MNTLWVEKNCNHCVFLQLNWPSYNSNDANQSNIKVNTGVSLRRSDPIQGKESQGDALIRELSLRGAHVINFKSNVDVDYIHFNTEMLDITSAAAWILLYKTVQAITADCQLAFRATPWVWIFHHTRMNSSEVFMLHVVQYHICWQYAHNVLETPWNAPLKLNS